MLASKLKRLMSQSFCTRPSILASQHMRQQDNLHLLPSKHLAQMASNRFFDIHQLGSKAAIEKERARLTDEMNRGYFADMAELNKHGGKVAVANKVIIPATVAMKFPDLEVISSDGKTAKLPIHLSKDVADADKSSVLKASLLCLTFRANSQAMVNSWSMPFIEAFSKSKSVHIYEVSFIDSWLLCRNPIKRLLLWTMKKPNHDESKDTLQKQMVYSFGDHYYFRKELKIMNLLTGYIFLLDKFGRIRWQGFGFASQDELSSLLACTSLLLEEE
ncbi:Mitochondria isoform 1 [Senna tora]|uniref:Mitochondria isoform 1 n=1 Tax=Senna tora TaxID=362788 RepID=A0A834SLM3_9FABA|nr:Mitochondria isoform 1 [Senna tora]